MAFVRWPAEKARRSELERLGVPRLLIVAPDAVIPLSVDPLEDWIRPPVEQQEVATRVRQLRARATARAAPVIDDFDMLRYGSGRLGLSAVEARLMRALIASLGEVVERDMLMAAGWPDRAPTTRNALDLHILRLRRRIRPLGFEIRTVWRRGYSLGTPSATPLREGSIA